MHKVQTAAHIKNEAHETQLTHPNMYLRSFVLSVPSTKALRAGVSPWVPLLLRDELNIEDKFHHVALSMMVCDKKESGVSRLLHIF